MSITQQEILDFMQTELGIETATLDPSVPVFSSGVIDSFSLVSLITFIERKCGITVDPIDVTLENLDSVALMLDFIARKREGHS